MAAKSVSPQEDEEAVTRMSVAQVDGEENDEDLGDMPAGGAENCDDSKGRSERN